MMRVLEFIVALIIVAVVGVVVGVIMPGSGHVEAATLDVSGVHIEGLQLQLAPAPAASAGTPVSPASSDAR